MPELPEVETVKSDLQNSLPGLKITDIFVFDVRVLKTNRAPSFLSSIISKTIEKVTRRGKMIIVSFKEGGFLCAHLKMTGQLIYGRRLLLKETKLIFELSNKQFLNYNDQRLFGRLSYVEHLHDDKFLRAIGPEPLNDNFNTNWLKKRLKHHRISIKTLLLNQAFVAGIGNIYASEILFDAGINPKKSSRRLTKTEIYALHTSTVRILKEAIKYRGTSMRNYRDSNGQKGGFINRIKVYNKEHKPCPICGLGIRRIVQNGRSTFFCQGCQQ